MADRPNVLLVLMDTARADAFEPWGAPAGSTPVVAELARRGTAFPMAVAPSSWTVPSHASMFTGLLPRAFGFTPGLWAPRELRTRMRSLFDRHRDRTLAEVLRHGGYATGAVSTNPIVNSATGFSTGFDWFGDPGRTRFTRLQRQRQRAAARRGPAGAARRARDRAAWWRARDDNGAVHAGRALRRWLDHSGGAKPFFAFVNLMETHRPYYPPRPWNDLGPAARWQAVGDVFRWQGHIEVVLVSMGEERVPEAAWRRMRHLYARSAAYMDRWLGALLEDLDGRRALDDTLVVVASDHGESFGENGLMCHGWSLDQRQVHVPLVMAGPGAPEPRPVESLASVPRIVASAVGLEDHPWADDPAADGIAVAQKQVAFEGKEQAIARARDRGVDPDALLAFMGRSITCATDGAFKLVRANGAERLYDLANDPLETADVAAEQPERVRALGAALDRADAAETAEGTAPAELRPGEEAEIEAQLESLGYL